MIAVGVLLLLCADDDDDGDDALAIQNAFVELNEMNAGVVSGELQSQKKRKVRPALLKETNKVSKYRIF
jgi:hypothetical protein